MAFLFYDFLILEWSDKALLCRSSQALTLLSKRHPRSKHPAYCLYTDLTLRAQAGLVRYGDRWPTEVDNFYLKTRWGIADYQRQSHY